MDLHGIKASFVELAQLYEQSNAGSRQNTAGLFSQGQLFQATVTGKDRSLYTIDIGQKQVIRAESPIPLQIGQQLELQVAATSPKTELQIVSDPLAGRISGSLYLLDRQESLAKILASITSSKYFSQLADTSRQTFTFMQEATASPQPGQQAANIQAGNLTNALLTAVLQALQGPPGQTSADIQSLKPLLQQMSESAAKESLSASQLNQFQQIIQSNNPQIYATEHESLGVNLTRLQALLNTIGKAQPQNSLLSRQLFNFFNNSLTFFPSQELCSILELSVNTDTLHRQAATDADNQLQQLIQRLGLNMEQLFAEGKNQQAQATLKFALLELNQHMGEEFRPQQSPSSQLLQTVDLYQMIQLRLAGESLFFLPLPFSFLEQGFLLIDNEESLSQEHERPEARTYSLHLSLEGLGNLKIEVRQLDNRASIHIYTEDREKLNFIKEESGNLQSQLSAVELHSLQFTVQKEKPVNTLISKVLTNKTTRLLNTKA